MHPLVGRVTKALLTSGAALGVVMFMAGPVAAAGNDDFSASTTDGCGVVNFVDSGEGAPGGGTNDDYLVIHDYCGDQHGVKAWAWITQNTTQGPLTFYLGGKYNGNGLTGDAVIWDPFKDFDPDHNVSAGDVVGLKVCLVDGDGDSSPSKCGSRNHTSIDG